MKKLYNRLLPAVIAMLAIMLLGACGLRDGEDIPEGSVRIYRTDIGFSKLTWEYYVPKAQDIEALVHEILDRLKSTPDSNVYNSIVPETVDIQSFYFAHEGELVLDFSESYSSMEPLQEILCRAGIVKTLCGLEGIDGVEFLINSQPLVLSGDVMAGTMTGEDFIDNTGAEVSFRQTVLLTVFYATGEGNTLSSVRLLVESNGTRSQEELALEQLIGGPGFETTEYMATLPADTKVNKILVRDGICYLDLSEEFLNGVEGITDEVSVYSLVNTLTELSSVNKVRITVDSASVKTYGSVPIDGFLERRPDLTDTERAGEAGD